MSPAIWKRPSPRWACRSAIETRTGDTPPGKRLRQRRYPPDILLTTPEQLALLLSTADAPYLFATLRRVVLDELHSLVTSKRGDLLSLGLARLFTHRAARSRRRPVGDRRGARRDLRRYLVPQRVGARDDMADLVVADGGRGPGRDTCSTPPSGCPGPGTRRATRSARSTTLIRRHRTTLVFVNTRSQAEMLFQELWRINDDGLAIALHHGSLDAAQRRKVEAAMAAGRLQAVVCTSSLDLGIDWGDVDLVINVGAPKGASRLTQRIGRANHRLDEPSRAVLVPANRFEVLECRAAIDGRGGGRPGHAAAAHAAPSTCWRSMCSVAPAARRSGLTSYSRKCARRRPMPACRGPISTPWSIFVATGGYALRVYERFAKIRAGKDGRYRISHPRIAQQYRLNVGTIVEDTMIKVRLVRSRPAPARRRSALGRGRAAGAACGPGRAWRAAAGGCWARSRNMFIEGLTRRATPSSLQAKSCASRRWSRTRPSLARHAENPKVPAYAGGKFPLSTYLAARVRDVDLAAAAPGPRCRRRCANGSPSSTGARRCRMPGELLVETFPRADKNYLVCYPFEGRLAHQTLGMLLTRRLERARLSPLGFVANEYALAVWGLGDPALCDPQRPPVARSSCSPRTCLATISKRGLPNRP